MTLKRVNPFSNEVCEHNRTPACSVEWDNDVDDLSYALYREHAEYHGFKPRWDDEPWQSRFSWRNIARAALDWMESRDSDGGAA